MKRYVDILNRLMNEKIIAILRVNSAAIAKNAIRALYKGGLQNIEVTMNVPNVLDVLSDDTLPPDLLLGAGTVLDEVSCRLAILQGAEFIVTPTVSADVIRCANRYQKPVICGCYTPTEMVTAMELGANLIKIYPSNQLQYNVISSLHDPLPQVMMGPTGGVNLENIAKWKDSGAAIFGIGGPFSALANEEKYDELERVAARYREAIE